MNVSTSILFDHYSNVMWTQMIIAHIACIRSGGGKRDRKKSREKQVRLYCRFAFIDKQMRKCWKNIFIHCSIFIRYSDRNDPFFSHLWLIDGFFSFYSVNIGYVNEYRVFLFIERKKTFRSDEFSLYFSLIIGCVDSLCICFCKTEWLQWKFQFIMDEMFSCSRERTCDALNEYYDFISFFFVYFILNICLFGLSTPIFA